MPKLAYTLSILIIGAMSAMLATSATAEVTYNDDGPPGFYSVGPWEGRCIRDGWLSGSEHESCGADIVGPSLDVYLARTVKGLTVTLSSAACKNSVFKAQMTSKQLAMPNRASRLEALIQSLVKKEAKKCGGKSTLPAPITTADLTDILNETDGLEF